MELELASIDWVLLLLKNIVLFFYKTSYLNEEVSGTEHFPLVGVLWYGNIKY